MYIVINGGGKIAEYLAITMLKKGHEVAVIELDEKASERLSLALPGALVIQGDGCDSVFQADAGTSEADVFVATTGNDDDNLVSCEIAKLVFDVPRTIARVNSPKNERIFRRMGIEAVSSTSIISRMIEEEALEGAVRAVMSLNQGDVVMTEITIPPLHSKNGVHMVDGVAGRRVADISLPKGSLLAAVGHNDSLEIVSGETILFPGDTVVILSKSGLEDRVKEVLLNL